QPSPENYRLYRPVDPRDPALKDLAASIREKGVLVPLVLTEDNYILSGHRRFAAAKLAGLREVPCVTQEGVQRVLGEDDDDDDVSPDFLKWLEHFNRQREKTLDEKLREAVVRADPKDAHAALSEYREASSAV